MSLASLSVPCLAGHYEQTAQSGGQVTTQYGSTIDYSAQSGSWGAAYGSWGMNISASCSGPVTTTFEWTPDIPGEPVPDNVLVQEDCTANWSGTADFGQPPTGSANNDLGFPEAPSGDGSPGGTSSGTRYQILGGAKTITLTVNPSASISTPGGTIGIAVSYHAQVSPVDVMLGGGIGDYWAKRFLIGQQVSASVETGGLTASSIHWSISGGRPFSDYVVGNRAVYDDSTNPPTYIKSITDGYGILIPLGSMEDLTEFYHYAEPATSTVACTLHLDVPSGAKPESGLDVAPSRQCLVESPTFWHAEVIGAAVVNQPGSAKPGLWLAGASYSNTDKGLFLYGSGTYWAGQVETPGDFIKDYGAGVWQYTQTIIPAIAVTINGVTYSWSLNGITQVDDQFNYAGYDWPGDNSVRFTMDGPGIPFGAGYSMVHDQMSCSTYMMYKPGGDGSCYVPLTMFNWYWDGTATLGADGTWSLSSASPATITAGPNYPAPPTWGRNASEESFQ